MLIIKNLKKQQHIESFTKNNVPLLGNYQIMYYSNDGSQTLQISNFKNWQKAYHTFCQCDIVFLILFDKIYMMNNIANL